MEELRADHQPRRDDVRGDASRAELLRRADRFHASSAAFAAPYEAAPVRAAIDPMEITRASGASRGSSAAVTSTAEIKFASRLALHSAANTMEIVSGGLRRSQVGVAAGVVHQDVDRVGEIDPALLAPRRGSTRRTGRRGPPGRARPRPRPAVPLREPSRRPGHRTRRTRARSRVRSRSNHRSPPRIGSSSPPPCFISANIFRWTTVRARPDSVKPMAPHASRRPGDASCPTSRTPRSTRSP